MTRSEADKLLHQVMWLLADNKQIVVAWMYEEARERIRILSNDDIKTYADFVLQPGRRGRIRLVLHSPYEARAIALLFGILKDINE